MCSKPFRSDLDGILLLKKPLGMRSTSCVNLVKRTLGKGVKIGHAGTLDSTAEGLLIVMIGKATRLSDYVMNLPKTYSGVVQLGLSTTTDDASGDVLNRSDDKVKSKEDIASVLPGFIGTRTQIPPQISAIRVAGQRAHKVAREKGSVNLKGRPIFIRDISIDYFDEKDNRVGVTVNCHRGTYIRSIARDLGERLGCYGHLCSLVRSRVGSYYLSDAIGITEEGLSIEDVRNALLPISSICKDYTTYSLSNDDQIKLLNGIKIPLSRALSCDRGLVPSYDGLFARGESSLSICSLDQEGNCCFLKPIANLVCSHPVNVCENEGELL